MLVPLTSALVIASLVTTQTPLPNPPAEAPVATQEAAVPSLLTAPSQSITVPAGTTIQLTLVSIIKSKSTAQGDTVRAVVAFPVTIGNQMAIPAGTYVEGVLSQVNPRAKSGQLPFKIHFTRLIYANGYSVALSAESAQAFLLPEDGRVGTVEVAELTPIRLPNARFAMGEGQTTMPTMPTLSRPGPSPAVVVGAMAGGTALLLGLAIWSSHRARNRGGSQESILADTGLQFQMTLDGPVVLDAARVAAAAATPSVN